MASYVKARSWGGGGLEGIWVISRKIDGVRMLRCPKGLPVSRAGKRLHNLDHISAGITDCEVFLDNWETSVSMVRTQSMVHIPETAIYSLLPLDPRLEIGCVEDPTAEFIQDELELALARGDEGLVLRQGDKWLKVKGKHTLDVTVQGYQAGTGKYEGRLGALLTDYGKVGTGFKDVERDEELYPIGSIIEVECMELTPRGRMRHSRFLRRRFDKDESNVEGEL